MNPWPMVRADLIAMRWTAVVVVVLVGLAVAIGVAIGAQERALRQGSARAADDFDLVVGAPGSQTQLVLTTVYLQPEALPLMDGTVLAALAADPRAADVAPLAFGDIIRGYPVIGTTARFASRWGRLAPSEGRMFAIEDEAVIGADVRLALGDSVTPSHAGEPAHPGEESEQERTHRHEGVHYRVVGRLPRLGTPWDRAILIPVESVWETHGLGDGHRAEGATIGPPFDATPVPPTPALVVKPRSVADAYALRARFRTGGTMAVFPAEVLVGVYRTLGDVRDVVVVAAALNDLLVFLVVVLLMVTLIGMRRRRYAVLRALGAPPSYVLLVTWLGSALLLAAGCLAGAALGWAGAYWVAAILEQRTGLAVPIAFGADQAVLVALLVLAGSVLAAIPALVAWRAPPADALRG
ncbi:MAG: FtsX-like permease family protein [Acetobacteraceae bacterium]